MKVRNAVLAVALVGATFAVTRAVYSQDGDGQQPGMPTAEQVKAMAELAAPGEEHAKLASLVGTWDTEMTCEMGGQPMTSRGTMTTEALLGGRVLLSRFSGDMGGTPFEGVELKGYDNQKKQHWSVWSDSMGTGYLPLAGRRGEDGSVAYTSEPFDCPMNGPCTMEIVTRTVDADHVEAEMVMKPEGGPAQRSTLRYTRREMVVKPGR